MMEPSRKGWCPSLATPMATGDGLLARLYPRHGQLSPVQLAGLCDAASRHGNGLIEITTRGNLQARGLSAASAPNFEDAVLRLGIEPEPAPEIRMPPVTSLDITTAAALAAMGDRLRAALDENGLAGRLSAKFAILLDTNGDCDLDATSADVRLTLLGIDRKAETWRIAVAGNRYTARPLGVANPAEILAAAVSLSRAAADFGARARALDLSRREIEGLLRRHRLRSAPHDTGRPARQPAVGRRTQADGTVAIRLGLAFGQIETASLSAFCRSLPADALLHLLPGKTLMVAGIDPLRLKDVEASASLAGMVTRADDPRLSIVACAGAPACASGVLTTRLLAQRIVDEAADLVAGRLIYLAGCPKQCARPESAHLAVTGDAGAVIVEDRATNATGEERARLAALAGKSMGNGAR